MTLDGFVSTGPNDEQQWVTWALGDIHDQVLEILDSSDTILIGRKLAVDYIPYWQGVVAQPNHPMHAFSQRICNAQKIIFTTTLEKNEWENTRLEKGDLVTEVRKLKAGRGKDIVVYGGTSFVSALIAAQLIDEFYFFLNPIAIGRGESVFRDMHQWQKLKLKKAKGLNSGITLLNYELESANAK